MAYTYTFVALPLELTASVELTLTFTPGDKPLVTVWRREAYGLQEVAGLVNVRIPDDGLLTVIDYAPRFGTNEYVSLAETNTDTVDATVDLPFVGDEWLKHLTIPARSMRVEIASFTTEAQAARAVTTPVIGRTLPVAAWDVRGGRDGDLQINVRNDTEATTLRSLLADGSPLLLQTGPGNGVDRRVILVTDTTAARRTRLGTVGERLITLPTINVATPSFVPPTNPDLTWDTLVAAYTSWDEVVAMNDSWASLELPPTAPAQWEI